METKTKEQLNKILAGNPKIKLIKPCRIGDGILTVNENEIKVLSQYFDESKDDKHISFFIPASGSGSRMFEALFDYLNSENNIKPTTFEFVERLLNRISEFAFYNKIPRHLKLMIKSGEVNIQELIDFIINAKGMELGFLPKGLIPFHRYGKFIINPFQEHIIQGAKIGGDNSTFHFTIDRKFESQIDRSIQIIREISGIDFNYDFSEQDKNSHAIAFDKNNDEAKDNNNNPIHRPAGHGTLINNLNQIQSDLIFIKNIDNVQHYQKANQSLTTRKVLGGLALKFQEKVFSLIQQINSQSSQVESLATQLNESFNLDLEPAQLSDHDFLTTYFNRPIRVCGMVKNAGQPGGGPFWIVDKDNNLSKQIIEKITN